MRTVKTLVFSALLLVGACLEFILASPADNDKRITAVYIEGEIVLDGNLDELEWSLAQPATDFIQNEPDQGEPATERTEVRILYNNEYLYLGIYCFDEGYREGMVLTEIFRDVGNRENDYFSVVLDTFDDDRNAFLFGMNPVGSKRDGQLQANGGNNNFNWDAIWHVESKITDSGWQAEMAIPFRTLRFNQNEGELVWGVNFERAIRRRNEFSHWAPVPRPHKLSAVSFAGTLEGLRGIRQGRNLYLKPYLSAPIIRREGDDVDFVPEVGLDVKYGLTPGLTLDLTVNTDFAQVEADRQQINLTRFSLFFPEKRDFFLENAGNFQFGESTRRFGRITSPDVIPFFSRRIGLSQGQVVPILGGARLTGTIGDYTLGALSLQTDKFEETPSTNFSVFRLRRNLFRNSDFGGIFINKQESEGTHNRTYGIDGHLRFFDFLEVFPFLLKTDTPDRKGDDTAAWISVSWGDPFWEILGEYLTIEENFNPEVGFAPRTGIRKSRGSFGVKPRPGERVPWIRQVEPFTEVNYITDPEGVLETRILENRFSIRFEDNSYLSIGHKGSFERLDEPFQIRPGQEIPVGDYRFDEVSVSFTGDRSRLLIPDVSLQTGGFFDGDKDSYGLGLTVRPNYHFTAQVSWDHDEVDLPSGDFTTNLINTRLLYSFNPRMFLNALIQYNSTVREIESNIRFNFIYKPLSDIFLVYNERRSTTGEVRERALIAKLTYTFGL